MTLYNILILRIPILITYTKKRLLLPYAKAAFL